MRIPKLLKSTSIATLVLVCSASLPASAENIIDNGTFDSGYFPWEPPGWWAGGSGTSAVDSQGRFCTTVTGLGFANWGAQLRQNDIPYVAGEPYTVSFKAWASAESTIEVSAVDESEGFTWIFGQNVTINAPLDGEPQEFNLYFTGGADATIGKFRFVYGAGGVPVNETICFDDIVVDGPEGGKKEELPPASPVHVSQLGYIPNALKVASYALPIDSTDITTARVWSLVLDDNVVASGTTTYHSVAIDPASGDYVHQIDFSNFNTTGDNYTLIVNEGDESFVSEPFAIGSDIYSQVKYDALVYFYHNRSGTPILADVVGDEWSRPAGHESDAQVQTLACATDTLAADCTIIDSAGGWYDAGDHGKYVVNGGISVWTMLNQYERFKNMGSLDKFNDGKMMLPATEASNGVNDLLDEARWQVEWLLKMQVPSDQPLAGMAYHKMHDENWTGLPTAPHEDTQVRYVHPPSTAATLNLAAVAAQCARVYKTVDPVFAQSCLNAALSAYEAAKQNPAIYATSAGVGGGPYDDTNVTDEFYWAATELYLTTGQSYFASEMASSERHFNPSFAGVGLLSWQDTDSLGLISLAITPRTQTHINPQWVKNAQTTLTTIADNFVISSVTEGYGLPLTSESYPWGSNSAVLNNMLVLGLAYDFTAKDQYINAMIQGADYIFGRNPLGHSYVTGYGTRAERYPHHRFWAEILNPNYPAAPAGAVSGGPNSSLQDPFAAGLLTGCAPQRCFVDNIQAWSVNEITINWNAPFAWVTAYLDEYATNVSTKFHIPASIIATERFTISDRSSVRTHPSGNIYAGRGFELGANAIVQGNVFVAGQALLRSQAIIDGNLSLNATLTSQAGSSVENLVEDALVTLPVIPTFTVNVGLDDVIVNTNQNIILEPGSYDNVIIRAHGQLVLAEGEYHFRSLTIESSAQLTVDNTSLETAILIEQGLHINNSVVISSAASTDLTLYSNTQQTVTIGHNVVLTGNLIVPQGDVTVQARGIVAKIAAKNITLEPDVQINAKR